MHLDVARGKLFGVVAFFVCVFVCLDGLRAREYCSKVDTRVLGPWFEDSRPPGKEIFRLELEDLMSNQRAVRDIAVNFSLGRKILLFVDVEGGKGNKYLLSVCNCLREKLAYGQVPCAAWGGLVMQLYRYCRLDTIDILRNVKCLLFLFFNSTIVELDARTGAQTKYGDIRPAKSNL